MQRSNPPIKLRDSANSAVQAEADILLASLKSACRRNIFLRTPHTIIQNVTTDSTAVADRALAVFLSQDVRDPKVIEEYDVTMVIEQLTALGADINKEISIKVPVKDSATPNMFLVRQGNPLTVAMASANLEVIEAVLACGSSRGTAEKETAIVDLYLKNDVLNADEHATIQNMMRVARTLEAKSAASTPTQKKQIRDGSFLIVGIVERARKKGEGFDWVMELILADKNLTSLRESNLYQSALNQALCNVIYLKKIEDISLLHALGADFDSAVYSITQYAPWKDFVPAFVYAIAVGTGRPDIVEKVLSLSNVSKLLEFEECYAFLDSHHERTKEFKENGFTLERYTKTCNSLFKKGMTREAVQAVYLKKTIGMTDEEKANILKQIDAEIAAKKAQEEKAAAERKRQEEAEFKREKTAQESRAAEHKKVVDKIVEIKDLISSLNQRYKSLKISPKNPNYKTYLKNKNLIATYEGEFKKIIGADNFAAKKAEDLNFAVKTKEELEKYSQQLQDIYGKQKDADGKPKGVDGKQKDADGKLKELDDWIALRTTAVSVSRKPKVDTKPPKQAEDESRLAEMQAKESEAKEIEVKLEAQKKSLTGLQRAIDERCAHCYLCIYELLDISANVDEYMSEWKRLDGIIQSTLQLLNAELSSNPRLKTLATIHSTLSSSLTKLISLIEKMTLKLTEERREIARREAEVVVKEFGSEVMFRNIATQRNSAEEEWELRPERYFHEKVLAGGLHQQLEMHKSQVQALAAESPPTLTPELMDVFFPEAQTLRLAKLFQPAAVVSSAPWKVIPQEQPVKATPQEQPVGGDVQEVKRESAQLPMQSFVMPSQLGALTMWQSITPRASAQTSAPAPKPIGESKINASKVRA